MENNLLPDSIVERAIVHIQKGMDITESIKLAFEEEENMIYSLLGPCGNLSKKGDYVAEVICKNVYINLNNSK